MKLEGEKEAAPSKDLWQILYTDQDPNYNKNAKNSSKRPDVSKRQTSPKKAEKPNEKAKKGEKANEESKFDQIIEEIKKDKQIEAQALRHEI